MASPCRRWVCPQGRVSSRPHSPPRNDHSSFGIGRGYRRFRFPCGCRGWEAPPSSEDTCCPGSRLFRRACRSSRPCAPCHATCQSVDWSAERIPIRQSRKNRPAPTPGNAQSPWLCPRVVNKMDFVPTGKGAEEAHFVSAQEKVSGCRSDGRTLIRNPTALRLYIWEAAHAAGTPFKLGESHGYVEFRIGPAQPGIDPPQRHLLPHQRAVSRLPVEGRRGQVRSQRLQLSGVQRQRQPLCELRSQLECSLVAEKREAPLAAPLTPGSG